MIFAHIYNSDKGYQYQTLETHARNVAHLAADFAKSFRSSDWALLAGLLHDAGKSRSSFQNYLKRCNGLDAENDFYLKHDHSSAGACWVNKNMKQASQILAYCIAGHHAGLADWSNGSTPNGALDARLKRDTAILEESAVKDYLNELQKELQPLLLLPPPWRINPNDTSLSFWIRMLFSCLTDADYLDTELFMDSKTNKIREFSADIASLSTLFFQALNLKQQNSPDTEVNRIRAEIRKDCESAAELPSGIFSLTVPTGGGKTLSSMAFAFRHALKHGKKRIIYVIPYTSILEQTTNIFREILGAGNVLEHHSNIAEERETLRNQLAAENWDAPVVVTTSVQFFESLYACKAGKCRKLHNIADSIVIIDEAQLLPKKLLYPCREAINQLAEHYGTTIVLSTATQPDFGFENVQEIIQPERQLYRRLKRTDIVLPEEKKPIKSWQELADEIAQFPQVLCIVNTRSACRCLYELMPKGTVHLSAAMCGEHRSRVIKDISEKLKNGESVRVISTQLVEAGVDFDFPVVYRAYTGATSIVQAAGRCNREGKLPAPGQVIVFIPPASTLPGELTKAADTLTDMQYCGNISFDDPAIFQDYDRRLTARVNNTGEKDFKPLLVENAGYFQFQFREAAEKFSLIEDAERAPVIVRYGKSSEIIETLRLIGPKREIMRKLQRFTVNIPRKLLDKMLISGFISEIHPGIYVQEVESLYSELFGFDLRKEEFSAEDLTL